MNKFHNPYNFVPALPLPAEALAGKALGHGKPTGHDQYHDDHWSGRIGIKLTVVSPLIIPTSQPVEKELKKGEEHRSYGLRKYHDEKGNERPLIPVTSFKGALRSAYEAITNSRMGVFQGHDRPPARRSNSELGAAVIPARIVSSNGCVTIELWKGSSSGWPVQHRSATGRNYFRVEEKGATQPMYAAWLPRYQAGVPGAAGFAARLGNNELPEHGVLHHAWLELYEHQRKRFKYWRVRELEVNEDKLSKESPQASSGCGDHRPVRDAKMIKTVGFAFVTEQNFGRKHDERFFFFDPNNKISAIELSPNETSSFKLRWNQLIEDYRAVAEKGLTARRTIEKQRRFYGTAPGKTAYSRHLWNGGEGKWTPGTPWVAETGRMSVGTLCYARLRMSNGKVEFKNGVPILEDLFPVMISRELGHVAPRELLDESIRPATTFDQLSPADRVFGWVAQERQNEKSTAAWRGQLRIQPIKCTLSKVKDLTQDKNNGKMGLPLAILGEPKVQQARFYLGETDGAPFAGEPSETGYFEKRPNAPHKEWPAKRLRGRKVYPHHRRRVTPGEYRRAADARDNQNRSITEWVEPGAVFETSIDVINLKREELGALLWLLDMNRWEKGAPSAHLRLGYGKPLGFGSVKCEVTRLDLADGRAKRLDYRSFDGDEKATSAAGEWRIAALDSQAVDSQAIQDIVGAFKKAVADTYKVGNFAATPFIAAWLHAARGFDDNLPIHYPRSNPAAQPEGRNFSWFVANNQPSRTQPTENSLGDLADGDKEGLPYLG